MTTRGSISDVPALKVLAGYLVFALALSIWNGSEALAVIAAYIVLLACALWAMRSEGTGQVFLREWLPLLSLPVLYWAIPRTAIGVGPFDPAIQEWDRLLFRTDAARTFAGVAPWRPLSELLHAAYLSYYAIIYGPPLLMYLRGDRQAFAKTVYAFTIAMVVCFAIFCVFPVDGPRYLWPSPEGVPDGVFRRIVSGILQSGSSRGTAFPSSHEAIALAIALSSMQWSRRVGTVTLALAILLGFGAVFGGFHYATDMMVGAVVGIGSWVAAKTLRGPG